MSPRPDRPFRSAPFGSPGRGRGDSGRGGAAQAVGLGATVAALVFAILLLGSAWIRAQRRPETSPSPSLPSAASAADVDVWVGDLGAGVKGVLSSEWGDPAADARYDEAMSRDLGLPAASGLAFYRLTVFNTGDAPVTASFRDGAVVITPRGGEPLPMRSLSSILSAAGGPVSRTLRWLEADRDEVEIPASRRHSHPVAFARRVPLADVAAVANAEGTAFHPRRMPGSVWSALLSAPELSDRRMLEGLKDL